MKTHRHAVSRSCPPPSFFSHSQTAHTYEAHSQDASACGQLRRCPRAAGSEVIMGARSICSLTPEVCLDYRNINRPGLTGSQLQPLHCLSEHRHTHTAACQAKNRKHDLMRMFSDHSANKRYERHIQTIC